MVSYARIALGATGLTLAALGVITVGYVRRGQPAPSIQVPSSVELSLPVSPPTSLGRGYPGLVVAGEAVDVSPEADGKLEAVHVRLGQEVQAGDLLATLNVSSVRQELSRAEAQAKGASAELRQALLEHQQAAEQLVADEKISKQLSKVELSRIRRMEKIAAARVASARAQLAERKTQAAQLRESIERASLRAPFRGIVSERYAAVGAVVQRNTPILRLVGSEGLKVRFAVPEAEAEKVALGGTVQVRLGSNGPSVAAQIQSFSPEIDAASRALFAEARLDTLELAHVPSGQAARVFLSPSLDAGNSLLER